MINLLIYFVLTILHNNQLILILCKFVLLTDHYEL